MTPENRKNFKVDDDYPQELKERVREIYHTKGFYLNLPIVAGAKEEVLRIIERGHEVRICTAPLTQHKHCVDEKFAWVEHHFGLAFTKRIIIAKDKTVIRGDYLIDDKPVITGFFTKTCWEHVVFDAPYNREAPGLRLNGWADIQRLGLA